MINDLLCSISRCLISVTQLHLYNVYWTSHYLIPDATFGINLQYANPWLVISAYVPVTAVVIAGAETSFVCCGGLACLFWCVDRCGLRPQRVRVDLEIVNVVVGMRGWRDLPLSRGEDGGVREKLCWLVSGWSNWITEWKVTLGLPSMIAADAKAPTKRMARVLRCIIWVIFVDLVSEFRCCGSIKG